MRKIVLLLVGVLVLVVPAAAQTELPADQAELLNRALTSLASIEGYQSYSATTTETEETRISVGQDGAILLEQTETNALGTDYRVVRAGNDDTVEANFTIVSNSVQNDQVESTQVNGELIIVDRQIYVQAQSFDPTAEVSLPATFELITSGDTYPALDTLDLDDALEDLASLEEPYRFFAPDLEQIVEFLPQTATRVTVEASMLEDLTETELIVVAVEGEDFVELLRLIGESEEDDTLDALLPFITPESSASILFALDADDNLRQYILATDYSVPENDATLLIPDAPAGSTLEFSFSAIATLTFLEINSEQEPITAP